MTITLVQITDTHIHDQQEAMLGDTHPDTSLHEVIRHAIHHCPNIDSVVLTGDLTHDGTAAACKRLGALLSPFNCPVYITLGNHDCTDIIQQHLLSKRIAMPERIEMKHWQLLFVDSHIEDQVAGLIKDLDIKRLTTQLQQCEKPALLFTHHPPVKINSPWMDEIRMKNGAQVLQQLSSYKNLHALAFGHIHQVWHSQYQHIEILGSPSSCVQFKTGSKKFTLDDNSPGYRVFNLHDNGEFDSKVIRLQT
jgi:Icc protein